MMALNDDDALDYDVEATIDNYLPWDGVYGDRTTVQLVSNTSGIPGINNIAKYGVHLCQFTATTTLEECGQLIYSTELEGTQPAGSQFDYAGSQWQLAGAVAEQVSNSTWRQAWDEYIGVPCGLEVFQFGNQWSGFASFTGNPDSLIGLDNPSIEGGAISNMQDYAKILLMHLRDGRCGDTQIMSMDSPAFMRIDRGGKLGEPYGMGWWIHIPEDGSEPYLYTDPGKAFGAMAWLDTRRMIGGYVAIDDYTGTDPNAPIDMVTDEIIPLVEEAVDAARAAVDG
jgi:CubicO group peptidase (beta-lactamase class C family)